MSGVTFDQVAQKTYKDQACFFLNAFWNEHQSKAEEIWNHWIKFKELDRLMWNAIPEGKKSETYEESTSLDEFWSHKFLESIGKTLSVVQFRTEFKKIDANVDKRMGIVEFLLWEYNQTVQSLISRPQGGDGAEIEKAQKLLDEVATAFAAAQTALDKATHTEAQAKKAKEAAVASEAEAKRTAEAAAERAKEAAATAQEAARTAVAATASAHEAEAAAKEQQAAVDALKEQEAAHAAKTQELQAKSEAGGVSGMKAKNELAQHLSEDPLPLRKAKLTAEASAKKTDKANLAAQNAKQAADDAKITADKAKLSADEAKVAADNAEVAAEKDRIDAEAAAAHAEKDRIASEKAVEESQAKLSEAEAYLEECKKMSSETYGTFWWLDRELQERRKYMPKTGKAKLTF